MSEKKVLPKEFFHQCNAVIEGGHFILPFNGLHSAVYIDVYAVLGYIIEAHPLCRAIAERFLADDVEVIIGLKKGGEIIAPWTAQNVARITERKVLGMSAEKVSDVSLAGKNILVVGGVLTTGSSAMGVIEAIRVAGGNIVGLGVFWNRGGITQDVVDVPKIEALIDVRLEAWNATDCSLCKTRIPITYVGWR